MREFDPSRAQIGAIAYLSGKEGVVDPSLFSNSKRNHVVNDGSYADHHVASYEHDDEDYTLSKEARSLPPRSHVEQPDFSGFDGDDSIESGPSIKEVPVGLNQRSFDGKDDMSLKEFVRARLSSLRAEVQNKEKAFLARQIDNQKSRYEQSLTIPTDTSIDRNLILQENPSVFKSAENALAILADDDANPVVIMLILSRSWGDEWYDWEIETIIQTARMDAGVEISRLNQDKVMALKVLKNTDRFFKDPRVFEKVCTALSGKQVDWGHIQEPCTHEIAACVGLVERYIKEDSFSDDVAAYVAAAAVRDGFILLPSVLSFAEYPFSSQLASNIGDEAIDKQQRLMDALEGDDPEGLTPDDVVQYMRLLRCQYHMQEMIDEVRS